MVSTEGDVTAGDPVAVVASTEPGHDQETAVTPGVVLISGTAHSAEDEGRPREI